MKLELLCAMKKRCSWNTSFNIQTVLKLQGSNDRYVFINRNGVANRVPVVLGQRIDDNVEIISNEIKEGDEIVVTGQSRLVDGSKLNIVK